MIPPHSNQVVRVHPAFSAWGRSLHMLGTIAPARPQLSPTVVASPASLGGGVGTRKLQSALYQGRSEIVHNPHGYYPEIEFFKPHHRAESRTRRRTLPALEERTTR